MKLLSKLSLIALLAVICASCVSSYTRSYNRALAKIDVEACRQAGGEVRAVCLAAMPQCIVPYPDAGHPCRDGSECQGLCVYEGEEEVEIGDEVVGVCQRDNDCGCVLVVEDGRLQMNLCVD